MSIPSTLEEAVASAKLATSEALQDGLKLLQVELVIPEIAISAQSLALQFTEVFASYGEGLKVIFPDTGAAALARRDWGEVPFTIGDLGSSRTPIDMKISGSDQAFLVVAPSSVEVAQVEKLANLAGDRPVVLLIPQLEDVAIVGIGLAARQLRERFLSTIVTCYYFRPLEDRTVLKVYPNPWQVWLSVDDEYQLIAQPNEKPMGEGLERLINDYLRPKNSETTLPRAKKSGILSSLQQFLRALSQ